ncbi:MAG: YbjQ family protein [archaeon]
MSKIIVTSGEAVPGKQIKEILGVVRGSTVRARNIGRDIGAGLKNLVGGEIKTYTDMANDSRDEAFNRMVNNAVEMKADAIIGFRFATSMIMQGAAEMLAYGTAVKLK